MLLTTKEEAQCLMGLFGFGRLSVTFGVAVLTLSLGNTMRCQVQAGPRGGPYNFVHTRYSDYLGHVGMVNSISDKSQ